MSIGPQPHLWKSGPDPVRHQQYRAWARARAQAHFRGEDWQLTFEDWVQVWGDRWPLRGRTRHSLALMRRDWHGPWRVDNCFLARRANYHYQQCQIKLENGTISQIRHPRPHDQP